MLGFVSPPISDPDGELEAVIPTEARGEFRELIEEVPGRAGPALDMLAEGLEEISAARK